MTKNELAKEMKAYTKASFITRNELANFLGRKCPKGVDKYIRPLQKFDGRYFINDVADSIISKGKGDPK